MIIFSLTLSSCSLYEKRTLVNAEVEAPHQTVAEPVIKEGTVEPPLPAVIIKEPTAEELFSLALKEPFAQIREKKLVDLMETCPESIWAARASFLLALNAMDRKDPNAIVFLKGAEPLRSIDDYILFYRARALKQQNLYLPAADKYQEVLTYYPDSVLAAEALFERAGSFLGAKDYKKAAELFTSFISTYPKSRLLPEAVLGLAKAELAAGRRNEALKHLRRLSTNYPVHPAGKAARPLIENLKASGLDTTETADERFQRASRLFDAAHYNEAMNALSPLAKDRKSPFHDRAALKTAQAQIRLKEYRDAEHTLKRYLKSPKASFEPEALYLLSLIGLRQDKEELLADSYRRLSYRYPGSVENAQALLLLGRFYEKEDPARAGEYYGTVLREFKSTSQAEDAFWAGAWLEYRQGRFEEAYNIFSSYTGSRPNGQDFPRFLYWSARSAERAGKQSEAAELYRKAVMSFPVSYYGLLAEARLELLKERPEVKKAGYVKPGEEDGGDTRTPEDILDTPETSDKIEEDDQLLELDEHYLAAKELLTLGLNSRAASELDLLSGRYSKDHDSLFRVVNLLYDAGDYFRALRVYRQHLSGLENSEKGRLYANFSFPKEVVGLVSKNARDASIDPCLAAAVMREESSFNPKVVSPTGAIGLMQIMPSTGRLIAKELGRDFEKNDLFAPEVNIEFGTWYLGHLLKRLNNDLILTIAGYNAGPNAAQKWSLALPSEMDEFVESIPYPETRNYVKKVLNSYRAFRKASGMNTPARAFFPKEVGKDTENTFATGADF